MIMERARRGDRIAGRKQRRKVKKGIYVLYTMRFALCSLLSLFLIVFYTPQSLPTGRQANSEIRAKNGQLFCG
jgi:hypothetical protein